MTQQKAINAKRMRLAKISILALKGSAELRANVAELTRVTISTVNRWVSVNDDNLTKAAVLALLRQELNLSDDQLLDND